MPAAEKIEASENKGLRPDHDQLPDEIKALYSANDIAPDAKKISAARKYLSDNKAKPAGLDHRPRQILQATASRLFKWL